MNGDWNLAFTLHGSLFSFTILNLPILQFTLHPSQLVVTILEAIYTSVLRGGRRLLPLLATGEGKLARGIRGRQGAAERLAGWAASERDSDRPLVWFHAPSVGESLQAASVMTALRSHRPEMQIAYTYFSPSAERLAPRLPADVADYLPIDLPDQLEPVLHALDPSAIVFSKTEVWPNLTRLAASSGIPVLLLSATLPATSSRLRWPTRILLRPAHQRLSRVGAISTDDAQRFAILGVPRERLSEMGDARFDQVARRAAAVDRKSPLLTDLADPDSLTLVAGSTWPEDEDPLLAAFAGLPHTATRHRMILVPHEPLENSVRELEQDLARNGIGHARLSRTLAEWRDAPVLIVDRVGILGELYALADVAFVGGGFGSAGLHSVLEPAAFGVPVLFGPRHSNAREADALIAAGGAFEAGDRLDLGRTLARLLTNGEARKTAGAAAAAYVARGVGAAERGAQLIEEFLPERQSA
ncbi:MAG: hypothetical protein GEU90_08520 [Gemmatimonas sp.]|nr:hypothetical protein [Gemmatimonas sp.]